MTEDAHRDLEEHVERLIAVMTEAAQTLGNKSRRYLRTQKVVKELLETALAEYRAVYGD